MPQNSDKIYPYTTPMSLHNQVLVDRIIKYFKERFNKDISLETAEEYLNSMADLYGCFIEFVERNETD